MPKAKDPEFKLRVVTFKLPIKDVDELDEIATFLGITRSELIRKALDQYIKIIRRRVTPEPHIVKL